MDKIIIKDTLITEAANALGQEYGLSLSKMCECFVSYATEYKQDIPCRKYSLGLTKKIVIEQNLECFSPEEQYIIISKLCEIGNFSNNEEVENLKRKLSRDYSSLAPSREIE